MSTISDSILPECQFDPLSKRDGSQRHYDAAITRVYDGRYIKRNLDHITMAMDIVHVARCVESIGDSEGIDPKILLDLPVGIVFGIKKDGTWNGYRNYILNKYGVDMGVVPADAQKPTAKIIEGTIQNWLNGEPLLFY